MVIQNHERILNLSEDITPKTEDSGCFEFTIIPSDLSPSEIEEFMNLWGLERAIQLSTQVFVDTIYLDEDVVDHEHQENLSQAINLDNQVESVSLVLMKDIFGNWIYQVTNGHHRIAIRKKQATAREERLTIRADVRIVKNDEALVYEMRLLDLNSQLTGVMFVRVHKWLNSAFSLKKWQNETIKEAIDKGSFTLVQAIELTRNKHKATRLRIGDHAITQLEKEEIVPWVTTMTRGMKIDLPRLKQYLIVAAKFPDEIIRKVEIKSGGGHEGKGKITFDLLRCISEVFTVDDQSLMVALVDECVKQNLSASRLKTNNSAVLRTLKQIYKDNGFQHDHPTVTEYLSNLSNQVQREETLIRDRLASHSGNGHGRGDTHNTDTARIDDNREVTTEDPIVADFWKTCLRGLADSGVITSVYPFGLRDGSMAYLDTINHTLVSQDETTTMELTPFETFLLMKFIEKGKTNTRLTIDEVRELLSQDPAQTTQVTRKQARNIVNSLHLKLGLFVKRQGKHPKPDDS